MIIALGIACTTWTLYEFVRLLAPVPAQALHAPDRFQATQPAAQASRFRHPGPQAPRYRAWDASGRPIEVVDLG